MFNACEEKSEVFTVVILYSNWIISMGQFNFNSFDIFRDSSSVNLIGFGIRLYSGTEFKLTSQPLMVFKTQLSEVIVCHMFNWSAVFPAAKLFAMFISVKVKLLPTWIIFLETVSGVVSFLVSAEQDDSGEGMLILLRSDCGCCNCCRCCGGMRPSHFW